MLTLLWWSGYKLSSLRVGDSHTKVSRFKPEGVATLFERLWSAMARAAFQCVLIQLGKSNRDRNENPEVCEQGARPELK